MRIYLRATAGPLGYRATDRPPASSGLELIHEVGANASEAFFHVELAELARESERSAATEELVLVPHADEDAR